MPQVTFSKDHDYHTKPNSAASSTIAYKKGMTRNIPKDHVEHAMAAGALEGMPAPDKPDTADQPAATT